MATITPRFLLPDIEVNQSQKEVTHNESLQAIDALMHGVILDRGLTAPPSLTSPADDGKAYLVKATGTGAWAGEDGNIAYFRSSGWTFYVPAKGMRFKIEDEDIFVYHDGTAWIPESETNLSRVSIESQGLTAPPGGETDGQAWIVKATATGDWAGQEDDIAIFRDGAWTFTTPIEGETFWVKDRDIFIKWSGTVWQALRSDELFQKGITDRTLSATPALTSPGDDGKTYIIGPTPTGDWDTAGGVENDIAVFRLDGWQFHTPIDGWRFYDIVQNKMIIFDGTVWEYPIHEIIPTIQVLDKDLVTAPGSPSFGDCYIIAGIGGDWSTGTIDDLAFWNGLAWQFISPLEGMQFWILDEDTVYAYDGTAWLLNAGQARHASYAFAGTGLVAGSYYLGGFYDAPLTDANLTQAATTQVHGVANISYAAHALLVAAAAGSASGGAGAVTIVVSGTSIDDAGTRTPGDSEVLVSDITLLTTDLYLETVKKWIGQVTYTLTVGGTGHTAYAADFNYGFSKYEDLGNHDFTIRNMDLAGFAGAADSSFALEWLIHNGTGWTYSAAAFVPGATPITTLNTIHSTEDEIGLNLPFSWKLSGLAVKVDGATNHEGVLLRIVTSVTDAIRYMNMNLIISVP